MADGLYIFSVGDSWKSYAVRGLTRAKGEALTDSTPSHCGMVVMDGLRPLLVHESTSEGHIVAESPREYFEKTAHAVSTPSLLRERSIHCA